MSAQYQKVVRLVVTVTTAGTPVQVNNGTALYVRSVIIQGHHGNTGKVFFGDSSNNAKTANAHALAAKDTVAITGDTWRDRALQFDLSTLWIDTDTNGSKAIITYVQETLNQ